MLATWEKPLLSYTGTLKKGLERKYWCKDHEGPLPQTSAASRGGTRLSSTLWSGQVAAGFSSQGISGLHVHFLILFSKHISDNKKGQGGNEVKKTGQPQEASSSQALQHPGPAPNGHYPPQSRGGNLPPPSIAVTRPPGPRGYGMMGYPPRNPRFPGPQPGLPRGSANYR